MVRRHPADGDRSVGFEIATVTRCGAGDQNFTAQVTELVTTECDMVWATALPTEFAGITGTSAQMGFAPRWIAQSPAGVDELAMGPLADYLTANVWMVRPARGSQPATWQHDLRGQHGQAVLPRCVGDQQDDTARSSRPKSTIVVHMSYLSHRSVASAFSVQSLSAVGSVSSVGSAGSIASVGSAGSILSLGSAGSLLSIGSAGSIFSYNSSESILHWNGQRMDTPKVIAHAGLIAIIGIVAGVITGLVGRRLH